MADVFSKEQRSDVMRAVKSKNTKSTEGKLIKVFKENHITGWRHNYQVKGHPDFVFLEKRVAIFVDGCFWHGHDCRNTFPANNADYWSEKRERNIHRDRETTERFEKRGWTVVRIWECELARKKLPGTVERLLHILNQPDQQT